MQGQNYGTAQVMSLPCQGGDYHHFIKELASLTHKVIFQVENTNWKYLYVNIIILSVFITPPRQ